MKRFFALILCIAVILSISACGNTLYGEEDVIEKARKEIPIADAENIEIKIIGGHYFGDKQAFWLMTGNEYQANSYFVMDTEIKGEGKYEFVKLYEPIDRGMDIRVQHYTCVSNNVADTYHLFMVNNKDCVKMVLNGEVTEIEDYPFVYKCREFEGEYVFLDKEGNEIR